MSRSRRIIRGRGIRLEHRSYTPNGRAKSLGAARTSDLGDVTDYGPARTITLIVGQNKGKQPHNRGGQCKTKPRSFSTTEVDRVVMAARSEQVGRDYVGATRRTGRGFYQGDAEDSVAYEIAYIPPEGGGSPAEASFSVFSRNMDRLAERLAQELCQDEVLIIRDDGKKRIVAGARWDPE